MLGFVNCKITRFALSSRTCHTTAYRVIKGKLGKRVGEAFIVYPDEDPQNTVSAVSHPRGKGRNIPDGATVFLSRPMVSNPRMDNYEVISFAGVDPDMKHISGKFACIHPERIEHKQCKNCPNRDDIR